MEEGYNWGELLDAVDLVADTFPKVRLTLWAGLYAEGSQLPEGHEGKALLLAKAEQLRTVGPTDDLRNLEPITI